MERGGGIAQSRLSHNGLLFEVKFDEAVDSDAVGISRPDGEIFFPAEVFYRFLDRDFYRVFHSLGKNALTPRGDEFLRNRSRAYVRLV
jgi:hypothetical protein